MDVKILNNVLHDPFVSGAQLLVLGVSDITKGDDYQHMTLYYDSSSVVCYKRILIHNKTGYIHVFSGFVMTKNEFSEKKINEVGCMNGEYFYINSILTKAAR